MIGKTITIGDTILYRYYNRMEKKFYGEVHRGNVNDIQVREILSVNTSERFPERMYEIIPEDRPTARIWLHRKEIKKVLPIKS